MSRLRPLAIALLLVFASAAVEGWVMQEPCGVTEESGSEQACSPLCLTCTCCAQPRVAIASTTATAAAAAIAQPMPFAALTLPAVLRKIPHVPKALNL